MMTSKRLLIASLTALGLFCALYFMANHAWFQINIQNNSLGDSNDILTLNLLVLLRWVALGLSIGYAYLKRNLTVWILIAMFLGVSIGTDFPTIALNLKVLSDIFLRLIKTIIAPLLFSTLVVGIAGHSNIKQVGRMGIKSIVYFELVTTVALFIGLGAIHLSRACEGTELHAQNAQI